MTLETLQLDDLDWAELTSAARSKIAGASRGEWTHHAPVDPGITILETYAAELDQRMYMFDQPSEDVQSALLRLLGYEPRPVRVAKTVVSCYGNQDEYCEDQDECCGDQDKPESLRLPEHTLLELQAKGELTQPLTFRTTRSIDLVPMRVSQPQNASTRPATREVVQIYWWRSSQQIVSMTPQVNARMLPPLLEPGVKQATTIIKIPLQPRTTLKGEFVFSVLLDLASPRGVAPAWLDDTHLDARSILPATSISWRLKVVSQKEERRLHLLRVEDGTLGLRRSGVVELHGTWEDDPFVEEGDVTLELWISADSRAFSFAPRVRQVVPNAVVAEHRRRVTFDLDLDPQIHQWKKRPGSVLKLKDLSGAKLIDQPASLQLFLLEHPAGALAPSRFQWSAVQSFSQCNSTSRVFVVDRAQELLQFGDGLQGRIPVPVLEDDNPIDVIAEFGGGSSGNVAANLTWRADDGKTDNGKQNLLLWNPVPAAGGAEPESLEETALRCRADLRRPSRLITAQDIEQLALATPAVGLARAHAIAGRNPSFPDVTAPGATTLVIVPDLPAELNRETFDDPWQADAAIVPDSGMLQAVIAWLQRHRLIAQELFVEGPVYTNIDLQVVLTSHFSPEAYVRQAVEKQLRHYLHPIFGGPEQSGWPFGKALYPSELLRVVEEVLPDGMQVAEIGIRGTPGSRSEAIGQPASTEVHNDYETCKNFSIGSDSLVALRQIEFSYSRPPGRGSLP